MSHHSDDELKNVDQEFMSKINDMCNESNARKRMFEKLGPTHKFPEGKWQDTDEGEIRFAVYYQDRKVFLEFGTSVKWIGMNANQAIELGNILINNGRKANKI